jgi:hypothetical protein
MYAYAPSLAPRIEGNRLLVQRFGATLPPLCVKCGQSHSPQTPLRQRFQSYRWVPPWTNALIFAGLIPAIIVQSILTRTASITLLVCPACDSRWTAGKLVFAASIVAPLFVSGALAAIGISSNDGGIVIAAIVTLVFLIILVPGVVYFTVVAPRVVRTDFIDDYMIRLVGLSPAILSAIAPNAAPPPVARVGVPLMPVRTEYAPPLTAAIAAPAQGQVLVLGPDGREYEGTVVGSSPGQVQVMFPNGSSTWIPEVRVRPARR